MVFSLDTIRHYDSANTLDIYSYYIKNSIVSFEEVPPSPEEWDNRVHKYLKRDPWLVCRYNHVAIGYAYAAPHRGRPAYRWNRELSVYISPDFHGRNIGKALYLAIIEILQLQGYVQALAGISMPNDVSVAFHKSLGFSYIGNYPNIGYKHGKWCDVSWWYLPLGPIPDPPGPIVSFPNLVDSESVKKILFDKSQKFLI